MGMTKHASAALTLQLPRILQATSLIDIYKRSDKCKGYSQIIFDCPYLSICV